MKESNYKIIGYYKVYYTYTAKEAVDKEEAEQLALDQHFAWEHSHMDTDNPFIEKITKIK